MSYSEFVASREAMDFDGFTERLGQKDTQRLLHAIVGMSTESAEALDALKKHIYYGKKMDVTNIEEELGDCLFYIQMACNVLDKSMDELMVQNRLKLEARYKEKFTTEEAINRDLEVERKILEDN